MNTETRPELNDFAAAVEASGRRWPDVVRLFNEPVLSAVVRRVNEHIAPSQLSRLASEPLPTSPRQRTATNNRVGLLLEYLLVSELNALFWQHDASGMAGSFVLTNQYPDFVLRDASHQPRLRVEVKAVHLHADEMAANFDTPLMNVQPQMDLVLVLAWEWRRKRRGDVDVSAVEVVKASAFDAYVLAQLRDTGWLSSYTGDTSYKGIDVAGPVRSRNGKLEPEGGNMGKLMRIGGQMEGIRQKFAADPEVTRFKRFQEQLQALASGGRRD